MIKRYELGCPEYDYWDMVEDSLGEYVKFDDYQDLKDEYTDLEIKYKSLVSALGDLYRET
jgi:hypothetical protein